VADKVDTTALLAKVDIVEVIDRYVPLTKSGGEYEACCPFHGEDTPSFKVSPSKQFYHCFGCGAHGDAIGFLMQHQGLSFRNAVEALGGDLPETGAGPARAPAREKKPRSPWVPIMPAPADAPDSPKAHYARGTPQKVWRYLDDAGRLLGFVYRFVKSDGGKEVMPVCWAKNSDTGAEEWHFMAFPEPRPLYGLDRLAAKPEATVLLVEGEKCADAGHEHLPELAVVSWPGGGKADGKVDWSPLAGRKVVTWADADAKRVPLTPAEREAGVAADSKPILPEAEQAGVSTMARIRGRLADLGCKLWDVQLPPPGAKPDGWDIADAVVDGLRGEELADFIRSSARPVVSPRSADVEQSFQSRNEPPDDGVPPVGDEKSAKKPEGPLLIDAMEWLDDSRPQEWVLDGIVQRGCLYAVTAVTNHGKTAIGLTLAMSVAAGKRFAGRDLVRGKVLLLCGENPDGFRTRMRATIDALGLDLTDVAGMIMVLPHALPIADCAEQILEEARKQAGDYALVLVDTSVSYYSGDDEDDNLQARSHAWHLRALTELPGHPAVLANCHPTKSADKESLLPRGGGAFLNEIDCNLTVWAEGEVAHLHWQRKKRGPDFDPIPFEFHGKSVEEHGNKIPTVVAMHISETRAVELKKERNQAEDRLLWVMMHHPEETFAGWASACGWNGDKAKSKVFRVMERLKEDKLVAKNRRGYVLTKPGEEEAKKIH
jgi:hypothetical protein